ncbi:MAG: LptF/LptG family permease [Candidatus Melainabacteria bacterium]
MNFRLLDRYLFRQLLDFFLLGIIVFTLVAFFSDALLDLVRDIQKYGISPMTMMTVVGLQLPKSIALILPASSFLAVLMVYNKLNNQFEIIAMRSGGISLQRMIRPALWLGLITALLSYGLYDYVVPYCNAQTAVLKRRAIEEAHLPSSQSSFLYKAYDDRHNLLQLIYVGHYKGRRLGESTIIDLSKPKVMKIVQARSGYWHPEQGWLFKNANIYAVLQQSEYSTAGHSDSYFVKNLLNKDRQKIKDAEIEEREALGINVQSDLQPFVELWGNIQRREAIGKRVARKSYLSLWKKITLPLSCVVLILLAIPLAITPPRQGSQRGFVFSLAVLFLYYLLQSVFEALGRGNLFTFGGMLPVSQSLIIAAWLPVALMGLAAVLLIRRKAHVL